MKNLSPPGLMKAQNSMMKSSSAQAGRLSAKAKPGTASAICRRIPWRPDCITADRKTPSGAFSTNTRRTVRASDGAGFGKPLPFLYSIFIFLKALPSSIPKNRVVSNCPPPKIVLHAASGILRQKRQRQFRTSICPDQTAFGSSRLRKRSNFVPGQILIKKQTEAEF